MTAAETLRDLLTGGPVSRHHQHDPIGHRQRCQGNVELVVLLLQNGNGARLRRPVKSNETGREPARDGRPTGPADDEIRARPVEPGADVVWEPTSLRLHDKAKERFLCHVCGEFGVARRPESHAVDRGRVVTEGRRDHLADRR